MAYHTAVTAVGTPVTVDVLYNDSNYVGGPTIASKSACGSDSFPRSIADAYGKMATATVSITVQLVVVRIEMNDTATQHGDVRARDDSVRGSTQQAMIHLKELLLSSAR